MADVRYVYYCERCLSAFEIDVDPEKGVPSEAVCPKCEYPHAVKAYPASVVGPQSAGCSPDGSC